MQEHFKIKELLPSISKVRDKKIYDLKNYEDYASMKSVDDLIYLIDSVAKSCGIKTSKHYSDEIFEGRYYDDTMFFDTSATFDDWEVYLSEFCDNSSFANTDIVNHANTKENTLQAISVLKKLGEK